MKRESLKKSQYNDKIYSLKRETHKKNIKLYTVKAIKRRRPRKTSFEAWEFDNHGQINNKDTKAKCRHLKKFIVRGICGRCLSEFPD
jgi:hypothetical protein